MALIFLGVGRESWQNAMLPTILYSSLKRSGLLQWTRPDWFPRAACLL